MVNLLYTQYKTLQGSWGQTLVPAKMFLQFHLELFYIIFPKLHALLLFFSYD